MIRIHSVGPVYWAAEHEPEDPRWLTHAWVVEDREPYRRSIWAFRVKLLPKLALHLGLCKKTDEAPHKPLQNYSPSEIGSWGKGGNDAFQEEATEVS